MENVSNTQLLYDVIDTLTDEEFKDLLNTLSLTEKAEKIEKDEEPIKESVQTTSNVDVDARKQALMERIDAIRKKKTIQEKLEVARKRKAIQERIEAARKAKVEKKAEISENAELKAKIMEKLEIARKKKAIQERIKKVKESK